MFRPPSGDEELRHGYTVSQVRALSLAVVTRQTWYQSVDFDDRLEVAWHAIIEHLYTASETPAMPELARAAEHAVSQDIHQTRRFYGRRTDEQYVGWERYWHTVAGLSPGHDAAVIERVAVTQILPRLRPANRQAIAALTDHDDYALAAEALGISRHHFSGRIGKARREFLSLWHEGEIPSRLWAYDYQRGSAGADSLASANRTIAARRRARGRLRRPAPPGAGKPRIKLAVSTAELARRYRDGQSIRRLAASLGVNTVVIRHRLKAEGVQFRSNGRDMTESIARNSGRGSRPHAKGGKE
jgi:hypothetical protein